MAMQSGLSSSKVLILMGAGLTGSIILRNGRLSDVISELQELFKGVNEAEVSSNHYDASLLAAQIRHLAQEVRTLTLSRPVTILNGESTSNGTLASYLLPAAAVGAMGYCYMWWKGWSISDVMFVTKRNMANAVANVSKQLEQVSATLAMTKRHLTQRLEKLAYKLDEQKETVETIMKEVHGVKTDLSQIGFDIEEIQNLLSGLEGKMELLENKQDATNLGISYLCQIAGGIKDGLHTKFVQEATAELGFSYPSLSFLEAEPRQGLQFLAESLKPREAESIGIKNQQTDANISFKRPLTIHRFYQSGISLKKDGLLAL